MRQLGSLLSRIAFLFLFSSALSLLHPIEANAISSLNVVSLAKEVRAGDRVSVDIRIRATDQSINALSGVLSFPDALLKPVSIDRSRSVINFWTREPSLGRNRIPFEGIVLNPGFQGSDGQIFRVTFEARRSGRATVNIIEGSVLANDGLGTNIVTTFGSTTILIASDDLFTPLAQTPTTPETIVAVKVLALPVITDYSASIGPEGMAYLKGKGEPGALTRIVFKDSSFRSIGEQFITSLQTKRKRLDEVLVKNDPRDGTFEYNSSGKLVAGAYNATPFLVDESSNTERPGLGVQFLVNDSKLVRGLVVLVNVLALLIPIVGLVVLIYFIPWYSFRRMRVIKRRLGLEERRIELSQHQIGREDKMMENSTENLLQSTNKT